MHFAKGCQDFNLLPTRGFSIKQLKVRLLAGDQKATDLKLGVHEENEVVTAGVQHKQLAGDHAI